MSKIWRSYRYPIVGFLVLLALGIGVIVVFATRPVSVIVEGVDWRREIQVENYLPRRYGDWDETVPSDAYERNCYRKQRGSHQVYLGETCVGTGNNEVCTSHYMTVPDYDTWCDYTADRWGYARSLVTAGTTHNDPAPSWAALDFTPCPEIGCEREGMHSERYQVYLSYDDVYFGCPVAFAMWGEYRRGDRYVIQIGRFLPIPRCETIKSKGSE